MLAGRIFRARLYDRALTTEELEASYREVPYIVSEAEVLAALPGEDRQTVVDCNREIAASEVEIENLVPTPIANDDRTLWGDAARALFTLKEFIYLR